MKAMKNIQIAKPINSLLPKLLPVGTRSVLYGAHCWFIHPFFVALAWTRLYGLPTDLRLWLAFFTHDLGYLFLWCENIDGPEGERHVEWGANLMGRLFGEEWRDLCLYHSRFRAKQDGKPYSKLCVADKLATALEPWWLYLPRVILSGEIHEYMALAAGNCVGSVGSAKSNNSKLKSEINSKYKGEPNREYVTSQLETGTIRGWHRGMTAYLRDWVRVHRDGGEDTWTPVPVSVPVQRSEASATS